MTGHDMQLRALNGTTVHGWMAALGLTRVLAQEWPGVTLRWQPTPGSGAAVPVWTDGPADVHEAVAVVRTRSLDQLGPGEVLPGLDQDVLTGVPGRGAPLDVLAQRTWTGAHAEMWRCALFTAARGRLHPMIWPHAAQTLHTLVGIPSRTLRDHPGLLLGALTGLGLTERYPGGLWMLRHEVTASDSPTGKPASRASPGRDWLAIMALPWMPPADIINGDLGAVDYTTLATGWWIRTGHRGRRLPLYGWRPWATPLRADLIPHLLDEQAKREIRDFAVIRRLTGPHDPPMLAPDQWTGHPDRRAGLGRPDGSDELAGPTRICR